MVWIQFGNCYDLNDVKLQGVFIESHIRMLCGKYRGKRATKWHTLFCYIRTSKFDLKLAVLKFLPFSG